MASYLTANEIEELAESLIKKFYGKRQKVPVCVDIEGFTVNFLKLDVQYASFAEADSSKIGFISDGVTPLCIRCNGIKNVVFPKGTIVIDYSLCNTSSENRRRFTLAHEVSHYLMDRTVAAASFYREYDSGHAYTPQELKTLLNFREGQMDRMAAAILMPGFMMRNNVTGFTAGKPIMIYGENLVRLEDKLLIQKMAKAMGVSYTAFFIRLKQLSLYEKRDADEFITQEMCLGNGGMYQ